MNTNLRLNMSSKYLKMIWNGMEWTRPYDILLCGNDNEKLHQRRPQTVYSKQI